MNALKFKNPRCTYGRTELRKLKMAHYLPGQRAKITLDGGAVMLATVLGVTSSPSEHVNVKTDRGFLYCIHADKVEVLP